LKYVNLVESAAGSRLLPASRRRGARAAVEAFGSFKRIFLGPGYASLGFGALPLIGVIARRALAAFENGADPMKGEFIA
jgi:hypothetical protein